jgi:hypothetical protein
MINFSFFSEWLNKISVPWRWVIFCLGLLVLMLVLQAPTLHDQFLSDDYDWVSTARTHVEEGRWFEVFRTENGGNFYRPLVAFSFQFDYALWHYNTLGYHLHQFIFHYILVLGVAWLIWQVFKNRGLAFAVALLFAVYPSQHEVVTWIAGRPDLYATTFIVLSIAAYATFLRSGKWVAYAVSLVFSAAAMLSKETGLFLPIFLFGALLICRPWRPFRKFIGQVFLLAPWLAVIIGVLFIRSRVLTGAIGGYLVGGQEAGVHFTLANLSKPFTSIFYLVNWDYVLARFSSGGIIGVVHALMLKLFLYWKFYVVAAGLVAVLYLVFSHRKERIIFLLSSLFWSLVAFIPVYSLSSAISPTQLSGSRLFFFSSVGYAMLIALLFWPAEGVKGRWPAVRRLGFILIVLIFVILWKINVTPWRMASDQVAQAKDVFRSQQVELLDNSPTTLMVRKLPGLVYGAYTFFGNHIVRGFVYEITNDKNLRTFLVGARPYSDSPLCVPSVDNRVAIISWDNINREFVEENAAAVQKLAAVQTLTAPVLVWDFGDPQTTAAWDFSGLEYSQSPDGVIINIPSNPKNLGTSPAFSPVFNGNYRYLDIKFSFLDSPDKFGQRQISLYWGEAGAVSGSNNFKYAYGSGTDMEVRVPLCQFLNWSISEETSQIKILPAQSGRILLKELSLLPE